MKFPPMKHQEEGHKLMDRRREFALLCEQGTGKTYMLLADAERLFLRKRIDAVLIIAPKGVHTNWTRREIPKLMSLPYACAAYIAGLKTPLKEIDALYRKKDCIRILSMNIDAVSHKKSFDIAKKFLLAHDCMMVVDESSRIKNPSAVRTKRIMALGAFAVCRRILSGTPIPNSPSDAFSQFEFLKKGLLGTTSYRAFVAEYTELLPPGHYAMKNAIARIKQKRPNLKPEQLKKMMPQIPAVDPVTCTPIYKNIEKLNGLLAPHSYRVRKADCLDLPPKVYKTVGFQLSATQRKLYDKVRDDLRVELEEQGTIFISKLASMTKLQQVLSGFIMHEDEVMVLEDAPERLALLQTIIEDVSGQLIIWARFREEIKLIVALLANMDVSCVEYHGGIGTKAREEAVDQFQAGDARVFVGNPAAGGIGLTLTAAETAIYYSSDFNLENRLQSEDRCHRIGTTGTVVYIDIVAENTIDERVRARLQAKEDVAKAILDSL